MPDIIFLNEEIDEQYDTFSSFFSSKDVHSVVLCLSLM